MIYLSKIGALHLLFKLFNEVIIPKEVYGEIIRGREKYHEEVDIVEEFIREGKIKVINLRDKYLRLAEKLAKKSRRLHSGEISAILLAKQERISTILVDDRVAYSVAKAFGLKPVRTTALLLILLKNGEISFLEFKSLLLSLISAGFYITADIYELILKLARSYEK